MDSLRKHSQFLLGIGLLALLSSMPVFADDTEIFTTAGGNAATEKADIVFILDTSGSMNDDTVASESDPTCSDTPKPIQCESKLFQLKMALKKILFNVEPGVTVTSSTPASASLTGNRLALMRFQQNGSAGGHFMTPLIEVTDANVWKLWCAVKGKGDKDCPDATGGDFGGIDIDVNGIDGTSYTPLSETLYEAALFFKGDAPTTGDAADNNVSGVTSGTPKKYISPLASLDASQCASNAHIVLLTDGQPYFDDGQDSNIKSLVNEMTDTAKITALIGTSPTQSCGGDVAADGENATDNCLDELAGYLRYTDGLVTGDNTIKRNVATHTIAFDLGMSDATALLKKTAEEGAGRFFPANDTNSIASAFTSIVNSINPSTTSFVAPALSVSQSNSFAHDKDIFYALFEPTSTTKWKGNLKAYQMVGGVIKDFSATPIRVFDDKGLFVAAAKDKWDADAIANGDKITAGGAGKKLPAPASRIIKTTDAAGSLVAFDATNVTPTQVGLLAADTAGRDAILTWARGGATMRDAPLGDPLHSQPAVVNYSGSTGKYVFFATNEGFIHSIDADDGVEKFAFIPKELLGNLKTFQADTVLNEASTPPVRHPYGIDGNIVAWVNDANNDGAITTGDDSGDHVYLYFGQRRGGNHYYALDVTDPTSPVMKWQINGGTGTDVEGLTFLADLGETWSTPVKTKIKTGAIASNTVEDVLVFGGGYDSAKQDVAAHPSADTVGKAIYIVDATDGSLVWKAIDGGTAGQTANTLTLTSMDYSIPSDIAVIDLDMDEIADRLYFGDMGGQVFRIDLNTHKAVSGTETYVPFGIRMASLGSTGADYRRFYYAPDIALVKAGIKQYLSINIGSGYRASPKSVAFNDHFYALRDDNPFTTLVDPTSDGYVAPKVIKETISDASTEVALVNVTSDISTGQFQTIIDSSHQGWFIQLGTGEKVLAPATSAANVLLFTTYIPAGEGDGNSCSSAAGNGKLYMVSLADGTAARVDNSDPDNPAYYRSSDLTAPGIPPSPLVFLEDKGTDNPTLSTIVGTETIGGVVCDENSTDPMCIQVTKTFWEQITE